MYFVELLSFLSAMTMMTRKMLSFRRYIGSLPATKNRSQSKQNQIRMNNSSIMRNVLFENTIEQTQYFFEKCETISIKFSYI